jgi:transposase
LIFGLEVPDLNKFEKEQKVIELHSKEGKTLKEIAKIVKMSFRDISKIIKAYERKITLQAKRGESNQSTQPKKPSISSQAFILFKEGKQIDEVKVLLDIPCKLAIRYWRAYLKAIRMFESFEFYLEHSYDIPTFLSIDNYMKRNNVFGKDILKVLKTSTDIDILNKTYYNLKSEIKNLELKRMYLLYNPTSSYSLQPLLLNKPNYNYYNY